MRVLVLGHSNPYADYAAARGITMYNVLDSHGIRIPGLRLQHEPLVVADRTSVGEILSVLYRRGLEGSIDVVFTNSEAGMVTAAALTQLLGAKGLSLRAAVAARDKAFQKQLVDDAGLPVTPHAVFGPGDRTVDDAVRRVGFPAVVKPLSCAGSLGVTRVRDRGHLDDVLRAYPGLHGDLGETWLLEAFVAGTETHLDGLVVDGQVRFLSAGRYRRPLIEVKIGRQPGSVILDPASHAEEFRGYRDLAERALAALGLTDTVFHLECFDTPQGPVFSECATRCGGQLIVDAIEAQYGIDLERAAFQVAVSGDFDPPRNAAPATCAGWIQLPVPQGMITRLPDPAAVQAMPGTLRVAMSVAVGDEMPFARADITRPAGIALVEGRNEAQVEERLTRLVDLFELEAESMPTMPPRRRVGSR